MDLSKFESYGSGFDMWRDAAIGYGMIPARIMCNQYLKMQEKQCAADPVEAQFCQELRDGMAAGLKFDNIPVYQHGVRLAEFRGELDLYNKSVDINRRCAEDIDVAMHLPTVPLVIPLTKLTMPVMVATRMRIWAPSQ